MANYIHYGSDKLDRSIKIAKSLTSPYLFKPNGLWASRTDAEWGWKQWCEAEDWSCSNMSKHFEFSLADYAKILEIHKLSDIAPYILPDPNVSGLCSTLGTIDFERICSEFDGMELFISDDYMNLHGGLFNTWDCDSICIWNLDVINTH